MPSWYFLHSYISCLCLCYLCFVHTTDEDGSSAVETFGRIIMTSLKSIVTKMGCQSPHITGIVGGGDFAPLPCKYLELGLYAVSYVPTSHAYGNHW